jgi:Matrixin
MTRPKVSTLRMEALEDRTTPAIFGEPWLDGRHLTLSFAADGTPISGVGSNLASVFSGFANADAARFELLRAFQTWAYNANLNIGIVSDNSAQFGTAGAIQSDPRFGDIRIGARDLAGDVIAVTAPFSLLTANSGDLILNSGKWFSVGDVTAKYDLFTVALQEAGHAFGVGNSSDTLSAMYQVYGLARTGLSDGDIASIQGLYGARANDAYEGTSGNETRTTASAFTAGLEADLSTVEDVDNYRYVATSSAGRWFRIRAAGLSLVNAKLEVLDATGQVIGTAQATGPLQNDVTVNIPALVTGATYYLRVSSARSDVFGVGSYRLVADTTSNGTAAPDTNALVDSEILANNSVLSAVTIAHSTGPYDYSFRSSLASGSDVDYFRVHSPNGSISRMTVTVAGVNREGFLPDLDLYSAAGMHLNAKIIAQTDSTVVMSVEGVTPNTDYLIRVGNTGMTTGNYDVVADFRAALPKMMGANGTLNNTYRTTAATLNIWQSQTVQVNLLATLVNGFDFVGLARIYDSQNRVVFSLFSLTGLLSTGQVFLPRGVYKIQAQSLTGATINFGLTLFGVTDPIGTAPTDPTGTPSGGGTDPLPPPPDPTTTVGIIPTTTTTGTDPATGATVNTTIKVDTTTGNTTTTTTRTLLNGIVTTATILDSTAIFWF